MYKSKSSEKNGKTTWIQKVGTFVAVIVATSFFWVPAILFALDDYAIQEHAVVATNKALVKEIHQHGSRGFERGTDLGIEYTTNTGERIETHLTGGWGGCCDNDKDDPAHQGYDTNPGNDAQVGDTLKIKYVSGNPYNAFPADYQPRYIRSMFLAGCFLFTVSIVGWFNVKEWRAQKRDPHGTLRHRQLMTKIRADGKRQADAKRQAKANRKGR